MRIASLIKTGLFAGIFIVSSTSLVYTFSGGAPAGSTGGPGKPTCSQSGCHTGNPLNAPGGSLDLVLSLNGNPITEWLPGNTYDVQVSGDKPGTSKYGFQTRVISLTTDADYGVLTAGSGNKIISDGDFTYATHSNASGTKVFNFKWTPPANPIGNDTVATFYTAFNCANGTGGSGGDFIYTKTSQYRKTLTSGFADAHASTSKASLYPNPASNYTTLTLPNVKAGENVQVNLISSDGKKVSTIVNGNYFGNSLSLPLQGIKAGAYSVQIITETSIEYSRILVL